MRLRSTLILGLIAVGLGAYLYFVEFDRAAQDAKTKTLLEVDQEAVSAVTLTYPDREIALQKGEAGWRLTKPVEAPADETTVKNLIRAIAECEVKKSLDDVPADLAPFGLGTPDVIIKLSLKDRDLPLIRVGKTSPVGNSTYVQRADEAKVQLTGAAFHAGMDKQVKDLRDKQIVTYVDDDVTGIALQGPGRDVRLGKVDGKWRFEQPGDYAVDETTVRAFLSTLRTLRATDFATDTAGDLAPYGLDNPQLTITISVANEAERKQILIGGENDKKENYIKTAARPTVYTVGDWASRDLNKGVNDFRDKTVLAFPRDQVARLEIKSANEAAIVLTRGADKTWTLAGADTKPLENQVELYLAGLKDLKGYEVVTDAPGDPAAYGLGTPLLEITLSDQESKPLGTVRLGSYAKEPSTREYTAMRNGAPTIYLVRDYLFSRLDKHAADFLPQPTPSQAAGAAVPPAEDLEGFGDLGEDEGGEGDEGDEGD